MSRFLRRITIVTTSGPRRGHTRVAFKGKKRRKKGTAWLRPLERIQRRMLRAANTYWADALRGHNKTARKRQIGWISDMNFNQLKAANKAYRKLER